MTEPYQDVGTGDLIMSLALPCYADGQLAGVLAIDYSLREIGETLKTDNSLFRSEANLLAKGDGTVLLSSDERYVGKRFPIPEDADLTRPASLQFDGQACIARVLHNEETDLYVISTISPREIRDPALRSILLFVVVMVVFLCLLIRNNTEATLSAEKRELSVCFCDIADFTTISESYDPGQLAKHLGAYFEGMTRILQEHEATVDKFIGDAIMAFWGAPREISDHARLACHAILRCQEFIAGFIREEGRPPFRIRFGLNFGEAIVGNMGYEDRLSYTAIGDTVNVASRYEGINKVYGTSIAVTESVWELTREEFAFREIDTVVVKGRTKGMKVYELLGRLEDYTAAQKKCLALWKSALDAYHRRDWKRCLELLDVYGRKASAVLLGEGAKDQALAIKPQR